MKKLLLVIAAVILISVLIGCASQAPSTSKVPTSPAPTTSATTTPTVKTLKLGCSEGFANAFGIETKKTLELIVEDFNKSGGLVVKGQRYNIEMIMYDDGYTSEGGKSAAERLVNQDKVQFIVGPMSSPACLGITTVTEPAKMLVFSAATISAFKDPKYHYFFSSSATLSTLIKWPSIFKAYPNAKTIAIAATDDDTGHAQANIAKSYVKGNPNIQVIKEIYYPATTQDFSAIAATLVAVNPDMLDITGQRGGADCGLLLKSLTQLGWNKPVINNGISVPDALPICGAKALSLVTVMGTDASEFVPPVPLAVQIRKMYEAKYGTWSYVGAGFASPFYMFIDTVKKADSLDPETLRAQLLKGESFRHFLGTAIPIKRPDLGNNNYCDVMTPLPTGTLSGNGGQLVITSPAPTVDEVIKLLENVFGYPGQWR